MSITMEPTHRVPGPAGTSPRPTPSATSHAASPTRHEASGNPVDTVVPQKKETTDRARKGLVAVCLLLGPFIAFAGFFLSFTNLAAAAQNRFGFPTLAQARLFALGVDGAILLFLAADLLFVARGRRTYPLLRPAAHAMTAATIYFNATAHGSVLEHLDKALPHAAMPILFVVTIETARHYLVQAAALEMGLDRRRAPLARWILAPRVTFGMWSRMTQWGKTYDEVMTLEQQRAVYRVWLEHREELEAGHQDGMVNALDRLPMTMKKFGLSVDEALALPDTMRREAQERQQRAAAAELHLALAAEKAEADAEVERLRVQGEIDRVRASVQAGTGVAAAEAEAAEAAARLHADSALAAARRAADIEERRAAAEEAAEESAKVTEARAKEKAERAKLAEASAKESTALATKKAADAAAAEDEARRKTAQAELAEATRQVAEADAQAAEARARHAEATRHAVESEALASLTPRELRVRVVARLLIDSMPSTAPTDGHALARFIAATSPVTGAQIADAINVSSAGTASDHKTAALDLIARGYHHHRGTDPDLTAQQ